ncbi:expressed conserved protein [Echinococcus multilocularis]|uniref:Expressed conserved protein n=1 Tax=Echinococcus multilocularis TaxID=6211 RepID=A0A068Y447_ECHMU|nr:expressed conserved protein [Echinococcus multilocularis]
MVYGLGRFCRFFSNIAIDFKGAYNMSGSLRKRPKIDRYGVWKSLGIAVPFIVLGGYISMKGQCESLEIPLCNVFHSSEK